MCSGLFLRHLHRILILKLEVLLLIPFLDPREDCAKETTMEIAGHKLLQRHECWGVEVTSQSFRSVMLKHVETCKQLPVFFKDGKFKCFLWVEDFQRCSPRQVMGGTVLDDSKCPKDAENAAVAEELAVQVWRRAVTSCDRLCLASLQGAWDLADRGHRVAPTWDAEDCWIVNLIISDLYNGFFPK